MKERVDDVLRDDRIDSGRQEGREEPQCRSRSGSSSSALASTSTSHHGYTGFLTLAMEEPWGGQMFVDLVIALVLFAAWMRTDAAREKLPFWPYFIAILTLGSIGALAYLGHRSLRRLRRGDEMTTAPS